MFLVKRIVGLRVLYIYSFAFDLVELGECTRIRGQTSMVYLPAGENVCSLIAACHNESHCFREEVIFRATGQQAQAWLRTCCDAVVVVCPDDMTIIVLGHSRHHCHCGRTTTEPRFTGPLRALRVPRARKARTGTCR